MVVVYQERKECRDVECGYMVVWLPALQLGEGWLCGMWYRIWYEMDVMWTCGHLVCMSMSWHASGRTYCAYMCVQYKALLLLTPCPKCAVISVCVGHMFCVCQFVFLQICDLVGLCVGVYVGVWGCIYCACKCVCFGHVLCCSYNTCISMTNHSSAKAPFRCLIQVDINGVALLVSLPHSTFRPVPLWGIALPVYTIHFQLYTYQRCMPNGAVRVCTFLGVILYHVTRCETIWYVLAIAEQFTS